MPTFIQLIYYFTVYSFLGWLTEVTFAAFITKKFVNRGFLYGPFCPIYGFGILSLLTILHPLSSHPFLFFIGTIITTSILEYITGFILEKIFHTHWWDYSHQKFNLHGYICLQFSLVWGVFGTLLYYFIHPIVISLINQVPQTIFYILPYFIIIYFLTDFALTIKSLINIKKIYKNFQKLKQEIYSDPKFIQLEKDFKKRHLVKTFPQIRKLLP